MITYLKGGIQEDTSSDNIIYVNIGVQLIIIRNIDNRYDQFSQLMLVHTHTHTRTRARARARTHARTHTHTLVRSYLASHWCSMDSYWSIEVDIYIGFEPI